MIKFIVAGLWLCAATIGAVIYSFQTAGEKAAVEPPPAMLGGLDYVKTDVLSVPVLKNGGVTGYFLTRLVYTVEPEKLAKLSVPPDVLFSDELYSFLFSNPVIDFTDQANLDVDALRNGIRERINKRVGEELIRDVMIDQIDFLSKDEIRNNVARRRSTASEEATPQPAADGHGEEPSESSGGH